MASDIQTTEFKTNNFVRTGGSISFEERPAQPSDFTDYPYAKEYAESPSTFLLTYPDWQKFADAFVMRRAVITINGKQRCTTDSFKASELGTYKNPGFVKVKKFAVPGSDQASIPSGKYLLTSFNFSDAGEQYTDLSVSYLQYDEWTLIQLADADRPKRIDGGT